MFRLPRSFLTLRTVIQEIHEFLSRMCAVKILEKSSIGPKTINQASDGKRERSEEISNAKEALGSEVEISPGVLD